MSEIKSPNAIAHYTIVFKIGDDGMGEVYRVRDGQLGDLEIKVLGDTTPPTTVVLNWTAALKK